MGTRFIFYWFTHYIASSYLEGCNFIRAAVSTPSNSMGHSVLLFWGSELQGFISRWFIIGGSQIFLGFHRLVGVGAFCLWQFEISRIVSIRPYNALPFTVPIITYVSVFILYPLGKASWFFGPSFGVAAIFRFYFFYKGFIIGHLTLST